MSRKYHKNTASELRHILEESGWDSQLLSEIEYELSFRLSPASQELKAVLERQRAQEVREPVRDPVAEEASVTCSLDRHLAGLVSPSADVGPVPTSGGERRETPDPDESVRVESAGDRGVEQESREERRPRIGSWPTTSEQALVDIRSGNSAYDREELADLGLEPGLLPFSPDMTPRELVEADAPLREHGLQHAYGWWDTVETRKRAYRHLQLRRSLVERPTRWNQLIADFGYHTATGSGSESVDLEWLTSIDQRRLDDWRASSDDHSHLLDELTLWIDDPSHSLEGALRPYMTETEWENLLLGALNHREKDVISSRYGLGGRSALSLERLGALMNVTRERVRQIQIGAFVQLRTRARISVSRAFVSRAFRVVAEGEYSVIRLEDASRTIRARLTPVQRLLLDIAYTDSEGVLHRVGSIYRGRLILGMGDDPTILELAHSVDSEAPRSTFSLPCLVGAFAEGHSALADESSERIARALQVSREYSLESGYVILQSRPKAMLDAIWLHRRSLAVGTSLDNVALGFDARDRRSAEARALDHGRRNLAALSSCTHLFMSLGDVGWIGLHSDLNIEEHPYPPSPSTDSCAWRPTPGTVLARLEQSLATLGLARLVEIRRAVNQTPGNHVPSGSAHAIVGGRIDRFERVAPGTYALMGASLDPYRQKLVTPFHAQHYLHARRCGETLDTYRAWTPELELEWCRWARTLTDSSTYKALLAYVDIESWPVDEESRSWWKGEQVRLAKDHDLDSWHPEGEARECAPSELFEILSLSLLRGGMNQHQINRVLNARTGIRTTWPYGACLVACGWLEDLPRWSEWHPLSIGARSGEWHELWQGLLKERIRTGVIDWEGKSMRTLRMKATAGLDAGRCAWLSAPMRRSLKALLESEEAEDPSVSW